MHNPLDSRQLANFCEIADAKSIRKAAKNLNLTTSAVSHSLKRLEEDLGCKLFERDTRSITLTLPANVSMAANEPVGTLTKPRYLVSQWGEIHQKTIRIGASPVACQHILPLALRELKESFPGMNIQILAGTSYQIINIYRKIRSILRSTQPMKAKITVIARLLAPIPSISF